MLTFGALRDWLTSRGITAAIVDGGGLQGHTELGAALPPAPDELVVITFTGGPGLSTDNVIDARSVQIRVRGEQGDPASAHDLAWQADAAFVAAQPPLRIGNLHVAGITRFTTPAFLGVDTGQRTHYTANYILDVGYDPIP